MKLAVSVVAALCGVKADGPTLVTRPASWNAQTFNRNVDDCSECVANTHPLATGSVEDCVQQYWFDGELFQYTDGYVCVPYGCNRAGTNSPFEAYTTNGVVNTPDAYCQTSPNARCVPELVKPNPLDSTFQIFFAYCLCDEGYDWNDTGGVPINFECASDFQLECEIPELNKCDRRSDCIELTNENEQGHRCDCKDGFYAGADLSQWSIDSGTGAGYLNPENKLCDEDLVYCCSDFDECNATPDICSTNDGLDNTHCVDSNSIDTWNADIEGGTWYKYSCQCNDGWEPINDSFDAFGDRNGGDIGCQNIDECTLGTDTCDEECTDNDGSYECSCTTNGYEIKEDGQTCGDEDECLRAINPCPEHSDCDNTDGSYICTCDEGREMIDGVCEDINQCGTAVDDCDSVANQRCANIIGGLPGYECLCVDGYYRETDQSCTDFDECFAQPDICGDDPNIGCENKDAVLDSMPYQCTCGVGWEQNPAGDACIDVDECLFHVSDNYNNNVPTNGPCNSFDNTVCTDNDGSYVCSCDPGYEMNNNDICVSKTECDDNPCGDNAACSELENGYMCTCFSGFTVNGISTGEDNFECIGDVCNSDSPSCQDYGECAEDIHTCADGTSIGTCIETDGSFDCECLGEGVKTVKVDGPNGPICNDIDECDIECSTTSRSFLTLGCNGCRDTVCVNLGTDNNYAGTANDLKTDGYQCACASGAQVQVNLTDISAGPYCIDFDECDQNTHNCGHNSICDNIEKQSPDDAGFTCQCAPGFMDEETPCEAGDISCFHNCVNINECGDENTAATHACSTNTECRDIENPLPTDVPLGYACDCNDGYEALNVNEDNEYVCSNIDECTTTDSEKIHNCDSRNDGATVTSECQDSEGDYTCKCLDGFINANRDGYDSITESGHTCENEDECQDGTFNACINGPLATYTSDSPVSCSDNDFITSNERFTCTCDTGYEFAEPLDGQTLNRCSDIDECDSTNICDIANGGQCHNTDGSYHCSCLPGYENVDLSHLGTAFDGTDCQNVNECNGVNECDTNAHCTDNDGSYSCECLGGWTGDGRSCMDYEECKNMMERGVSHTGTEWIDGNTYGGARGLTLMSNYTFNDCDQNAYCQGDENGLYTCHCLPGLTGDGFTCRDLDECGLTNDDPVTAVCDENASCINTFGTYECHCNDGYSGNGKVCANVIECNSDDVTVNECHGVAGSRCIDEIGSYYCECRQGTTGYGSISDPCIDINECTATEADDMHRCGANAACQNFISTESDMPYTCTPFESGYGDCAYSDCDPNACDGEPDVLACQILQRFTCTTECHDLDECALNTNQCDSTVGLCNDIDGDYECSCPDGYVEVYVYSEDPNVGDKNIERLVSHTCRNYNECGDETDEATHTCGDNTVCNDVAGTFNCECVAGYHNIAIGENAMNYCSDIDECLADFATNPHNCHVDADCTNADGTFECDCKTGFTGDGLSCTDNDECLNPADNDCQDEAMGNPWEIRARCINTHGSYSCACNSPQWVADNEDHTDCIDFDECIHDENGNLFSNIAQSRCGIYPGSYCTNTDGSFLCECNTGFESQTHDGYDCYNIDECATNQNHCDATVLGDGVVAGICTDHEYTLDEYENFGIDSEYGAYRCDCASGLEPANEVGFSWKVVDMTCKDYDECAENDHNCGDNTQCENRDYYVTGIKFICNIDVGYGPAEDCAFGEDNLWHCPDLDECTDDALNVCDNVNGDCENNTGSYTCSCNPGWDTTIGNDQLSDQIADIVCEDQDECIGEGSGHNCAADGNIGCVNSDGTFDCVCVDGAVEIYADGVTPISPSLRSCRDYNECGDDNDSATHNCDAVSTSCTNVIRYELADPSMNGYTCDCLEGFYKDDGDTYGCTDHDECIGDNGGNSCDGNASCSNNDGSYTCECNHGYIDTDSGLQTGFECELIVDCSVDNGGCSDGCEVPIGCTCDEVCWTIDNPLVDKKCRPKDEKATVTCGATQMDIELSSCLTGEGYKIVSNNDHCVASQSDDVESFFELSVGLEADNDCGTTISVSNGDIVFTQIVKAEKYSENETIKIGLPMTFEFQCAFASEVTGIAASNTPSVTANADTNVGNAGRGLFDFNINLYTDETMTTEMILNPSIAVGQRLNFGVEAVGFPSGLVFAVPNCKVNHVADDYDVDYYIVRDQCPDSITTTNYLTSRYSSSEVGIGYTTFKFDQTPSVHQDELSCTVIVCDASDPDSVCVREPDCSSGRKRRSIEDSQGSFIIKKTFKIE